MDVVRNGLERLDRRPKALDGLWKESHTLNFGDILHILIVTLTTASFFMPTEAYWVSKVTSF